MCISLIICIGNQKAVESNSPCKAPKYRLQHPCGRLRVVHYQHPLSGLVQCKCQNRNVKLLTAARRKDMHTWDAKWSRNCRWSFLLTCSFGCMMGHEPIRRQWRNTNRFWHWFVSKGRTKVPSILNPLNQPHHQPLRPLPQHRLPSRSTAPPRPCHMWCPASGRQALRASYIGKYGFVEYVLIAKLEQWNKHTSTENPTVEKAKRSM